MGDDSQDTHTTLDEDLSLPRGRNPPSSNWPLATVSKLVNEFLPKDIAATKESLALITDCTVGIQRGLANGVEFIQLIAGESNEVCEQDSKKTIGHDHVISALKVLILLLMWLCRTLDLTDTWKSSMRLRAT